MELYDITMAQDFINILCQLMENKDMQVTVKNTFQGALATGLTAAIGGLLLGPLGLAIGGALGGAGSAISSKNNFKSAITVFRNMKQSEKVKLLQAFLNALKKHQYAFCGNLVAFIMKDVRIQNLAIKVANDFIKHHKGQAYEARFN